MNQEVKTELRVGFDGSGRAFFAATPELYEQVAKDYCQLFGFNPEFFYDDVHFVKGNPTKKLWQILDDNGEVRYLELGSAETIHQSMKKYIEKFANFSGSFISQTYVRTYYRFGPGSDSAYVCSLTALIVPVKLG